MVSSSDTLSKSRRSFLGKSIAQSLRCLKIEWFFWNYHHSHSEGPKDVSVVFLSNKENSRKN